MALLRNSMSVPIRSSNKESEWSTLCDNVFKSYHADEDPFGLGRDSKTDISSATSEDIFDYLGSSGQQHMTSDASTASSAEVYVAAPDVEAKQPRAKAPQSFWTRTLCLLDRTATHSDRGRKPLRSAKSQPNFLGSDGFTSPPPFPPPNVDQSLVIQRQRPRTSANGKITSQPCVNKARSPSRGRSTGVSKLSTSASVNPYATLRKPQISPSKMARLSRYHTEMQDLWADRVESSTEKCTPYAPPESPSMPDPLSHLSSPSGKAPQSSFASLGASPRNSLVSGGLEPLSPPPNTSIHPAQIHNPEFAPFTCASKSSHSIYATGTSSIRNGAPHRSRQLPTSVSPNMTPELSPRRSLPIRDSGLSSFDFGFSTSPDLSPWTPIPEQSSTGRLHDCIDEFEANLDPTNLHGADIFVTATGSSIGLGITYDPGPGTGRATRPAETAALMTLPVDPLRVTQSRFKAPRYPYIQPNTSPPTSGPARTSRSPLTPRARRASSPSPSPTPTTEPRTGGTSSRRASRHRRTKSLNSTPRRRRRRHHSRQSIGGSGSGDPQGEGGFVNYTPHDSGKILSGVAPSGSSKTKARREKEAADKRRQLSQAAVKAVVDAGGDLKALKEAGLFVV